MSAYAAVAPGRKEGPVCVHQPSLPPLTVSKFLISVGHVHSIKLPGQHLLGALYGCWEWDLEGRCSLCFGEVHRPVSREDTEQLMNNALR